MQEKAFLNFKITDLKVDIKGNKITFGKEGTLVQHFS